LRLLPLLIATTLWQPLVFAHCGHLSSFNLVYLQPFILSAGAVVAGHSLPGLPVTSSIHQFRGARSLYEPFPDPTVRYPDREGRDTDTSQLQVLASREKVGQHS